MSEDESIAEMKENTCSEDEEPINDVATHPDYIIKLKRLWRQQKSGELIEKFSERNQNQKVSIYIPKGSHPYIIGHFGTIESVKGTICVAAILHKKREDTAVVFLKDWANRNDSHPIKRNFFFVFENNFAARTFVSIFNHALESYEETKEGNTDATSHSSEVDEDDLYNETQPAVDPTFPGLDSELF